MKPNRSHSKPSIRSESGFALVITLSMMVLLTVIAIGLLSLSSISLRASSAGESRAEAQANARMALILAIGQLQKTMGPDQAISARASSITDSTSEPNMLGTWRSWHWEPGTSGPDYGAKEANFSGWLVSSADPEATTEVSMASSSLQDPVWLVNPDTVGSPQNSDTGPSLRAGRVQMQNDDNNPRGAFAWGVVDESQKAPIQLADEEPTSDGQRLARRIAPSRARPEEVIAALSPDTLGDPEKIVSLGSAVVAAGKQDGSEILSYQADVTPYSVGLLSNVVDGGLKTDLTTVLESSRDIFPNNEPTLYFTAADGALSWEYLRNHYQLNRQITSASNGTPTMRLRQERPSGNGVIPQPTEERLLPVIAKMQIMFSIVSHYNHLPDRINFYNEHGQPRGNQNYAAPHLAYDPVITLYNPYDVALELTKLRVRVWDPPVVFRFRKNNAWLRPEFASGDFHGLARFQIANEKNENARRYFSMLLREQGAGGRPGAKITMQPGEVKVFSPWLEDQWTWGLETSGGYNVRCFFDWNADLDFGNKDGRTKNQFGIETVPGWDPRAGLQTDHLAYGARPDNTRYNFEIANNMNGGWLAIKLNEVFGLEAKAGRTVKEASQPDFVVDLLAGLVTTPERDMLRTYRFKYDDPVGEISVDPSNPVIRRNFRMRNILQEPDDPTAGGKSPFGLLTMSAKTTKAENDYAMPWLHNHPVVEGADQDSGRIGSALDSYDLTFREVQDFTSNGGIELDAQNRGFYGATPYASEGVSNVPMFRVPLLPASSLGDLVPANLISSSNLPRVTHALGNSRSHPLIPIGSVSRTQPSGGGLSSGGLMLDHSYLINDALWDEAFFSTVGDFDNDLLSGTDRKSMLEEFLEGDRKLLNSRFIPMLQGEEGSAQDTASNLDSLGDEELSKQMGRVMAVQGPFNVNSDSVEAWKALLASLKDEQLRGWANSEMSPNGKTAFSRTTLPIAGDAENNNGNTSLDVAGQIRWAGFRALTDAQIETLAQEIVKQIRLRGTTDNAPSLSLAEFVNRRLGNESGIQTVQGLLQTAIDDSNINLDFHQRDSKDLRTTTLSSPSLLTGMANPAARQGFSAEGAPPILTQGDLMMALAPVVTVRGDTFRVRAYGESKDAEGKIGAKAWCEAVVQRIPEYLDATDSPELKTLELQEDANVRFGRRFVITSFRWLSPEEV